MQHSSPQSIKKLGTILGMCKHDAFAAMPSQYQKMQNTFDEQYLQEAFIRAKDVA